MPQPRRKADHRPVRPDIENTKEESAILESVDNPNFGVGPSTGKLRANRLGCTDVAGTEGES